MSAGRRPLSVRARLTLWYSAVLSAILLLIGGLSYSLLERGLLRDLDASLLAVAEVVRQARPPVPTWTFGPDPQRLLRELLGPEFSAQALQLLDPEGRLRSRSAPQARQPLPLSPRARVRAARGQHTYETVPLGRDGPTRVLTVPITRGGNLTELLQVALPLRRTQETLRRYRDTLLVLVPLGLALAAGGGAVLARRALKPVDDMSRRAHRISAEDLSQRLLRRGTDDELDRLADTLNAMLVRLEAAFAQLQRFAADAAHELRTPLTALKGGIEVALRADRSTEEYRRVLSSSLEEVDGLIRLAEDLLLLSRSMAGPDVPRGQVELEALVKDAAEVGKRLAEPTEVAVNARMVEPATVRGDDVLLRRAVLNLIENAVKYTPAGGQVELSLTAGKGWASIAVQDTGIGIAAEDVARIFEPFVRLDAARSRDTGGSGLGLAIARSIVREHGGTVSVESRPGTGSRFTIALPLA